MNSFSYRDHPDAIRTLIDADRVHRDVYLDAELFALENERLFAHAWLYVGHASQIPATGDYLTTTLADQPVIMIRQADGTVRVLLNRCAHKAAMVLSCASGNAGKFLRCPYHAWTYKIDGKPLGVPLRNGYEGTRLHECEAGAGLTNIAIAVYRGFVFARLAPEGIAFEDYAGDMLAVFDNLADRSPAGELRVSGGCLRSVMRCNWKIYLENVIDAVHPVSTHESAWQPARDAATEWPADQPRPMALEQLLPFGAGYDFFQQAGARIYPRGHCILGTRASIHSGYDALPGYEDALCRAHGQQRAHEVLSFTPQNAVLFPTLALKSAPQTLRVIRPLAVDRTLVEIWALAPRDAPPELLQRTLTYNRLTFSPMSMVAHDDIHVFETLQKSLAGNGNPWVSLHREHRTEQGEAACPNLSGTSEGLMRNQFRAWVDAMASGVEA